MLMATAPHVLCGGHGRDIQTELSVFWRLYEQVQPDHVVYQRDPATRPFTLPVLIHGDEGRYLKKANWMVCMVEPALGSNPDKKVHEACQCAEDSRLRRCGNIGQGDQSDLDAVTAGSHQQVNDSGNEFLTKFCVFGMSSVVYKQRPGLLEAAFAMVARDMQVLHEQGFDSNGVTYYASTLGVKGDLKFFHQLGGLTRSYYNAGTKENHPICHLCMAGQDGCDFEDLSETAAWLGTMYTQKPWTRMPALATIPCEQAPEAVFKFDLFHCWKVGLGRDLTGSSTMALALLGYFDFSPEDSTALPERLKRAHSLFVLWCKAESKSPALHSFTPALLNYKNLRSFCWFNTKGSDTTLITQWLHFFVRASRLDGGPRHPALEAAMLETLESAIELFGLLHRHPLWLPRACAKLAEYHMTVMTKGYKVLARECHSNLDIVGFGFKPRLHSVDHIRRDLKRQLQRNAARIINPMAFSCESNESFVGHVSRLARRLNSRTVGHEVLDRICYNIKGQIRESKARLRTRRR